MTDRSFVGELARDKPALEIVRAISKIARVLGIKAIAVGVENREIMEMLETLGVSYAQGNWISMPRTL